MPANNLLRMLRRNKIQDMDVTLGTSTMMYHKSDHKHQENKMNWHGKEYIVCNKCKRTLWGLYEGKRLWAKLDDENAQRSRT